MFTVIVTPDAARQFDELPREIRTRVTRIFERLREWPDVSGAKRLSGGLSGWYRIRTGDYRVQFRIDGETIVVGRIGHRDGFYDG